MSLFSFFERDILVAFHMWAANRERDSATTLNMAEEIFSRLLLLLYTSSLLL